jgi:hypothetical protein
MTGKPTLIGVAALVSAGLLAPVAAAVSPLPGQYGEVGQTATVVVQPDRTTAVVHIGGKIGGTHIQVTLAKPVKIKDGAFAYSGKAYWTWMKAPYERLTARGTVKGTFTAPRSLKVTYKITQGTSTLAKAKLTLPFVAIPET